MLALSALELKRRLDKELADLLRAELQVPQRAEVPEEENELRQALLQVDPGDFERHVMSFFQAEGLNCAVSPAGRDKGIDGWADHPQGLLVSPEPVPFRLTPNLVNFISPVGITGLCVRLWFIVCSGVEWSGAVPPHSASVMT